MGCGCISACIEAVEGTMIWGNLGWENDYDPSAFSQFGMGGFTFDVGQVEAALSRFSISGI